MFDDQMIANLPVPHEDGSFVSARVSRLVELIREYDPSVDVRWIRPQDRNPDEPAFALVTRDQQGREYVIFYVKDEETFDGSVVQRLIQMDQAKKGNILSEIDAQNAAAKAIQQKLHKEQLEESKDLAYHILKSKKHDYRHNGVRYD